MNRGDIIEVPAVSFSDGRIYRRAVILSIEDTHVNVFFLDRRERDALSRDAVRRCNVVGHMADPIVVNSTTCDECGRLMAGQVVPPVCASCYRGAISTGGLRRSRCPETTPYSNGPVQCTREIGHDGNHTAALDGTDYVYGIDWTTGPRVSTTLHFNTPDDRQGVGAQGPPLRAPAPTPKREEPPRKERKIIL